MTPWLAQLLSEALETPYGLEITTQRPQSLLLALVHAIASVPGSGLRAIPSRTAPDSAIWLLRKEVLKNVPPPH